MISTRKIPVYKTLGLIRSALLHRLRTNPSSPPFTKGPAFRGIWKMVRLAHHPELIEGEGLGEIFSRCLLNYGLISNKHEGWFWGPNI